MNTLPVHTFQTYAGHSLYVRRVGNRISTIVEDRTDTVAWWDLAGFQAALAGDTYWQGAGSLWAYLRVLRVDASAVLEAVL